MAEQFATAPASSAPLSDPECRRFHVYCVTAEGFLCKPLNATQRAYIAASVKRGEEPQLARIEQLEAPA